MKDIKEIVQDRIDEDKELAKNISKKLLENTIKLTDQSVEEFFPELNKPTHKNRSNLPKGVPLIHQLLIGPPTIFDLEPLEERQFEERFRISIRTAEELVDIGRLIPNLYVRNPNRWANMNHMKELVRKSIVNGERVDTYFRTRNSNYNNFIYEKAYLLKRTIEKLKNIDSEQVAKFVKQSRGSDVEEACRIVGTRWAYLDVLANEASEYVYQLINDLKLIEASEFIHISKHLFVSPVSAAIGGDFIWGRPDIASLQQIPKYSDTIITRAHRYFEKTEQLEYLVHKITGVEPFHYLKDFQSEHIIKLLSNENLIDLKIKLFDTMEIMSRLSREGKFDPSKIDDWDKHVKEIKKIQSVYERLGRIAFDFSIGISVGFFIEPSIGLGAGVAAEAILGSYADKVGSVFHSIIYPDKHRFIILLGEFKKCSEKK